MGHKHSGSVFKGERHIRNCSCYGVMNLHEHGMKVVKRALQKTPHGIVSVDEMQFGLMPERGKTNAVFILRMMQEEYHAKGKELCMCLVDL